jgi:trehalose 6-phosphate synthase
VDWQGRKIQVKVYPISINVAEVHRIANSAKALEYETKLRPLRSEATIVRIDRAEPNKNVIRGFKAYELLLTRHPELHGKVTFLAFLVPSRTHIRQYQRYMDEIEQLIDQVNRAFGNDVWQPIQAFMENNYTQAIAGMKLYDVLLLNTIIEGMNLVAKEGPVVNTHDGVLILSESSGAYHQLAKGVLPVSPTDIEGTMETLYRAIQMSPEERKARAATLVEVVHREDINHWIYRQLEDIGTLI